MLDTPEASLMRAFLRYAVLCAVEGEYYKLEAMGMSDGEIHRVQGLSIVDIETRVSSNKVH